MPYMALQCFSCHHMQVKEVRKSSSSGRKWSCVICNENQSVRKVFRTANTAKEVRKFVQHFNFTAGQAAHAEGISRLETGFLTEDPSCNYRYQQEEMNETLGTDAYPGHNKSFKWDKYLPKEVCSVDEIQASSEDMRFTTTLPEPTSRRRTTARSASPPQKRRLCDSSPSRGDTDAKPESFIPSESKELPTFPSVKFRFGKDYGSECDTQLRKLNRKLSTVPESLSILSPTSIPDCSPKNIESCHTEVSRLQTSKWSKYLS